MRRWFIFIAIALTFFALGSLMVSINWKGISKGDWPPIIQSIGAIGSMFVAIAVLLIQNKMQLDRDAKMFAKKEKNILLTLKAEIKNSTEVIKKSIGHNLEAHATNMPFEFIYPTPEDPLPIHTALTAEFASITNSAIRAEVIRTYSFAKGLAISFRQNNELAWALRAARQAVVGNDSDENKDAEKKAESRLRNYAPGLQSLYLDFMSHAKDLIEMLPAD